MSAIILTTACFLLSILPPTCIQYLAFRQILQEPQRTRVRRSYLVIFLIEIVLFMAIFQFGWLEFRFLSYKKLLMAYWIPYVLSFSLISRPYAYQNLFVAGMQGIYTTTIHALSMNLVLLFIPRSAFFTYLPIHLVLYTALYVLFSPLLLVFFDRIFLKYRSLPLLAFWKYCAWLPILLSMYSGFLSLEDGPLAHDYFLPRIFHALSGIFIALIMYMGTKLIAQQVDLQRRNHLLAAQMDALSNYTSLLQDAQKRMSIFRHDSRHQLRLLIIGTTPIHGGLLVFIKHAVSPDIPDDKNDLLQEAPYAQFVPDLNQFSRLYEATFRYDLHNHLASLYLTIPYQS